MKLRLILEPGKRVELCFVFQKKKKVVHSLDVEHALCARNLAGCWGRMSQVESLPFPAVTGEAG